MKNIQIMASIADRSAGPTYSVSRLAQALAARGNHTSLYTVDGQATDKVLNGVHIRSFKHDFEWAPIASKLGFSRGLKSALKTDGKNVVFHGHGLWRMANIYPGRIGSNSDAKLILSPRGMLGSAALAFSGLQKRLFWALAQKSVLERVFCFHATSQSEFEEIRAVGMLAPIAIIPNGIDVPEELPANSIETSKEVRTVLYLGRIHPKKGIDRLIRAWATVSTAYPDWRLRIIGPSELGHVDQLLRLVKSLGLERVSFEEATYGLQKIKAYREADLFVLPTLNENFGLVVAEALAEGTPVISTNGAPWSGLRNNGCGWYVGQGHEQIAKAMTAAMACSREELQRMGYRGHSWMRRDFSWETVAAKMEAVYEWGNGSAALPDFVFD